jgi:hypothetical protein
MRTRAFWERAAERAARTFAQALLGALTAGLVVTDAAQWKAALGSPLWSHPWHQC